MKIIRWSKKKSKDNPDEQECLSEKIKMSRSQVWRLEKAQKFPRRIKLSDNAVGWDAAEVEQWLEARKGASQ